MTASTDTRRPGGAEDAVGGVVPREVVRPTSVEEVAEVLRAAAADGRTVVPVGGRSKLSWAAPPASCDLLLDTTGLDRIVEHVAGDLVVIAEAGVRLADLQSALAEHGQLLGLDPPEQGATLGGVVSANASGPRRLAYGTVRDLLIGTTVVLADGTVASAGGKVVKNVAGYDLAKLFTGSFGTLGLIVEVVMRLHPRPPETVTAVGVSDDPDALGDAASAVAHSPFGPECLDVSWGGGHGEVMARFVGAAPEAGAREVVKLMERAGLEARLAADDDDRWDRQRERQRSADGAVVRVSGLASELPRVLRSAREVGASLVGRAGMGLSWMTLGQAEASELDSSIEEVRRRLHPFPCVVLDAPAEVREKVEVWGDDGAVPLMRRVKARFDGPGVCNPGIFVGGI